MLQGLLDQSFSTSSAVKNKNFLSFFCSVLFCNFRNSAIVFLSKINFSLISFVKFIRVKQIIEIIPHNLWRYVKSNCNPSDIASRGVLPVDLINNSFGWNGPELIVQNETYTQQEFNCDLTDEEKKTFQVNTVTIKTISLMDLCKQFSSFRFFRRVVSYMLRYTKISDFQLIKI